MSLSLNQRRTISANPFVADPNPNTTPPAASDIFKFERQVGNSPLYTTGHLLVGEFNVAEAATWSFTRWVRNAETGTWLLFDSQSAIANRALPPRAVGIMTADLFVQVTAVSVIAATKLTISAGESAG